jgi:hypothetical protein
MGLAKGTKLLEFQFMGNCTLVLGGGIVPSLAIFTSKGNDISHPNSPLFETM